METAAWMKRSGRKGLLTYLLGFLAGVATGLLLFASRPDTFISFFSRWG